YPDFDLVNNDGCFKSLAKRMLKHENHVITMKCIGCCQGGAVTTSNNPIAWHSKCWKIALDKHPKAASQYPFHLQNELAPRIRRLLPKLTGKEFRALFGILEDQFWLTLFDLKTYGKYRYQRKNDKYKIYSGFGGDFSLEKMSTNEKYADYVLSKLKYKESWYSMSMSYYCVTGAAFQQNLIDNHSFQEQQTEHKEQNESIMPNSNNQANRPQFEKNKTKTP
ncbi:MAG: hypothetical protein ACPG2Y_01625, partial [Acholeplasmataceae bacterium]